MIAATIGDLAFVETISAGFIPCRTLDMRKDEGRLKILVELTAARGAWKRGELLWEPHRDVIPRPAVYKPRGCFWPRIRPFTWTGPT